MSILEAPISVEAADGLVAPLRYSHVAESRRDRLLLYGELDMASVPVLQAMINEVPPDRPFVVDLARVTFADLTGLASLRAVLNSRPRRLVKVIHLPGTVKRLLKFEHTFAATTATVTATAGTAAAI